MAFNPESVPSKGLVTRVVERQPGDNLRKLQKLAGSIKLTKPLPEEATNFFEILDPHSISH